jgi:hypothetical protein
LASPGIVTESEELFAKTVQSSVLYRLSTVHSRNVAGVEDATSVATTTIVRWCTVHEIDDDRVGAQMGDAGAEVVSVKAWRI